MTDSPASTIAPARILDTVRRFTEWLDRYGETSWDHQSYFAGRYGGWAKGLYYRKRLPGTLAVAPMIFSEALLPSARRLFHRRMRFPIADAHYAMGFAFLHRATGETVWLDRAVHFLRQLQASRCPGYSDYCWGYPFDWVTRNGVMAANTPLITTTPYVFEAFLAVHEIAPDPEWEEVLRSIVRHVCNDIRDFPAGPDAMTCSYNPHDDGGVVNASAYRAAMLAIASRVLDDPSLWETGRRNLNFVLQSQNPDGSWPYAVDGVRDFVDHFHTCFVMKALAKIHSLTGHGPTLSALAKGVEYYQAHLFDGEGLPRPFARAPRLTVYKRELYDCAECINLCVLLRDRFPDLNGVLDRVLTDILSNWIKPDGSFRSRRLMFGWDNVPMHRWAQSQMFRAVAFHLHDTAAAAAGSGNPNPESSRVCAV